MTDLKPLLQNKWLIVLGVIGIVCLLFGTFFRSPGGAAVTTTSMESLPTLAGNPATTAPASSTTGGGSTQVQESYYDQKLGAMLKQMSGVYHVSVMVTFDATEGLTLANNTKTTKQTQGSGNQTSSSEDIFQQRLPDGSSVPFVIQRASPRVRGVLVLVDAQDFYIAKSEIVDAIQNVLDVPAYKISVEPQKSNS